MLPKKRNEAVQLVGSLVTTSDMPDKYHGQPLVVLTVEVFPMWIEIQVMQPDGDVEAYDLSELEPWPFKVENQTLNHIYKLR